MFFEQRQIFQEGLLNRHVFSRRVYVCRTSNSPYYLIEQILIFNNSQTNNKFSRSLYFLIKQIFIFQEAISSPQTHIIFQETPYASNRKAFSRKVPPSNRYFVNRSRWLLLNLDNKYDKDELFIIKNFLF